MARAAIYARYSTEHQRDDSIDDQIRLCRERINREGWAEAQTYSDRALSGASLIRPGLQHLIADAMHGTIDVVVAEALDRLSRDQADVAALFKRLTFAGVRIVTLAEGEVSELHIGLKGTMNQLSSRISPTRPAAAYAAAWKQDGPAGETPMVTRSVARHCPMGRCRRANVR
jgi:site-specific DNA recombinase